MNIDNLKWWISSWEALKAIGGGISEEMEIRLQEMKKELKEKTNGY
jgi:hypothetical protein